MNEQHANAVVNKIKGAFTPTPKELDPFRAIQYGKHAILDLKDLVAYAAIEIKTDLPLSRLGRVSLERNGSELIGWDAKLFHVRDEYLELPVQKKGVDSATHTRLVLDFSDETLRTLTGIRRGELVHLAGEQLVLKVAIKQKHATDPNTPEFTARARVLPYQSVRFFQQRLTEVVIDHTLAGEQKHTFPLQGGNVRLRRMFLETENNDITKVEIRRDNTPIYEINVDDLNFDLKRFHDKHVTDDYVIVDFISGGWAAEQAFVPIAASSLQLVVTKRTAGNINVHLDYLDIERQVSM
ncbi:major capsid protein P2 [Vibrio nigripulchritudo]|uniref:major capsid protein P2 n=1 Tax=Vibrio nigripulchritudo TaxID=28173 RepID=UPI0005F9C5D8|nr:major capsid protein P2 [Vibrio nigripulchritudo]KJY81213.1 hypothetical protein TW74_02705 [Vibrio nigripulchritudo]